jgi:hypothetical protein
MADLGVPGFSGGSNAVDKAKAKMQAGPIMGDEVDGPYAPRSLARQKLNRLLSFRLLEGSPWHALRLTARGRAALKYRCGIGGGTPYRCPDVFPSHCPEVFDDHTLLPINEINASIDFMDGVMGRLDDEYNVAHRAPFPDNMTTWKLMLGEYVEDEYRGQHTLTGARASMSSCSTTPMHLNGSLREHRNIVSLKVSDPDLGRVCDISLSFEQLSSLLVSQAETPVTISMVYGRDGMVYSRPAPPPVSASRRMRERIGRGSEDLTNRVQIARDLIEAAKIGKRAKAEILNALGIVARDVESHGAFAVEQAVGEMSGAAEGLMALVASSAAMAGLSPVAGVLSRASSSDGIRLLAGQPEQITLLDDDE